MAQADKIWLLVTAGLGDGDLREGPYISLNFFVCLKFSIIK